MALGTRTGKSKFKPDPGKLYVAWQGFACDVAGISYSFARGERLRGDHPTVAHMGEAAFVEDGTPQSEWPTHFDAAIADAAAKPVAPKPPPVIDALTAIGDVMICVRPVISSRAGSVRQGTPVLKDDPRVLAAPEAFRRLIDTL